jgi:hypothetical protein
MKRHPIPYLTPDENIEVITPVQNDMHNTEGLG